jgi:hypothetical protein
MFKRFLLGNPSSAILALALLGCGRGETAAAPPGATTPSPSSPTSPAPPTAPPAPPPSVSEPPAKPRIDVIVRALEVPARVQHDQEFDLTLELQNSASGGPVAGIANVEIRARISGPTGATNVLLGSAQFRDLAAQQAQRKTLRVRAPHQPGLWTATASIKPFDFEDAANNQRETPLVVD